MKLKGLLTNCYQKENLMTKHNQKTFSLCLVLLTTVLTVNPVGGLATVKYHWKLVSALPVNAPVQKALLRFAAAVGSKTGGAVKITLFSNGRFGQERDYLEDVKDGAIEFAKVSAAQLGRYSPPLQVFSLPFIWRSPKQQHDLLDGPVGKEVMTTIEKTGFKGLAYYDTGFRSITTRVRPVRTPADLNGLKIRVMQSKPLIDAINELGAIAVPLGKAEVYAVLRQRVLDGWENNEPAVLAFNTQEVCKYFSYTRHFSLPDLLVMNKRLYDSVPAEIQKAIRDAAAESVPLQRKLWKEKADAATRHLKAKGMKFNEIVSIKDFQAKVKRCYQEYEPIVGKTLLEAIVAK
jgi:tripartite ATP-independent transporter DctP family solute receptor